MLTIIYREKQPYFHYIPNFIMNLTLSNPINVLERFYYIDLRNYDWTELFQTQSFFPEQLLRDNSQEMLIYYERKTL